MRTIPNFTPVRQYFPLPAAGALLKKPPTQAGSSLAGMASITQRMRIRGANPLMRSSFFNQDSMQRTLDETEARLLSTLKSLNGLEISHSSLQLRHDSLAKDYADKCDKAVALGWNYCPEKSSDFEHIPHMDAALEETPSQAGPYVPVSVSACLCLSSSLPHALTLSLTSTSFPFTTPTGIS